MSGIHDGLITEGNISTILYIFSMVTIPLNEKLIKLLS